MSDVLLRRTGRVGHITLNRPQALNALSHGMCRAIERALDDWADDATVAAVLIDAAGQKAFCAGGDLQDMYTTGRQGDFAAGRRFWRDEYRLNAKIAVYPKPYIALCQGYTMGGGVGVALHGSHRVVGESSRIAMPECSVGLVPDVGGTLLLARAPGRLGEYLGSTGARMGPGDALYAGFADAYVREAAWPDLRQTLIETGDPAAIAAVAEPPPEAKFACDQAQIDAAFGSGTPAGIWAALSATDWGQAVQERLEPSAPLSVAATILLVARARAHGSIRQALEAEYCFTARSAEHGEFLEGIRAAIIDKDRSPDWRHKTLAAVPEDEVAAMLAPRPEDPLWGVVRPQG